MRLLLTLALCVAAAPAARAADGSVHVYLQPLPGEASRLSFTIDSLAAVSSTGAERPLKLQLDDVDRTSAERQRLVASGRLPPGGYTGLRLVVKRAALARDGGGGALALPDHPVPIDIAWAVTDQHATVLWLSLRYAASIVDGVTFSPAFTAEIPPRPIVDHVGLVSNAGSNSITVFDRRAGQVVGVIETCARPSGLALDVRRRLAYVACSRDDEILSIDLNTTEVLERTRVLPGDRPAELALTPDGATLLAVNAGSSSVSFLDATTLARQDRVPVGNAPTSVLVEPTGRRAFVFNRLSNTVSVLDLVSRSVTSALSVDGPPLRGQLNARGDRLYVVLERSPFMMVIDPHALSVVTRARVTSGTSAIAVDTVRNLVCLAGADRPHVELYDPNALVPVDSIRTRGATSFLAFDLEDNALYVVSPDKRSVVVASLSGRKVTAEIDVGEAPYWVAVMGGR